MERIARERWEGKLKPGELDAEHVAKTYKELSRGTAKGYGKEFDTLTDENGNPSPEVVRMRQNLFRFSMAKDATMLEDVNHLLSGGKDVMRWEEFKAGVLKLNKKYNINYLQAEWQTALQAGKHAANWQVYKANKDIYPNLKYKTQEDKRVRDTHIPLNNIIRPIDDKFWDVAYPPNGWRCRCFVVQTSEKPTDDKDMPVITDKDIRPEFRINVGKTGQVFKESDLHDGKPHPYFALAKENNDIRKAFELAKLTYAPHTIYKGRNGGKVMLNIFADRKDLLSNYRSAKKIVDELGIDVILRPNLDRDLVPGHNPEYLINGLVSDLKWDFKENNYNGITNAFTAAKRQGLQSIVFDFTVKFKTLDTDEIASQIYNNVNSGKNSRYKEFIFIYNDNVVLATREDILKRNLEKSLKKLKSEP